MKIEYAGHDSPVFSQANGRAITCNLHLVGGAVIPFTASLDDTTDYGPAIYTLIMNVAAAIPIAPYVPHG